MVQTYEQSNAATYYIGQNVELGRDVVIAAGAVLEAAPNSRLRIEAGVCIGSGAVIQVYGGTLTIAAGANIGPEVLLVGTGRIDSRAVIGAESTLINPQVSTDEVIPARSLIGDHGQVLTPPPATTPANGHNGTHPRDSGTPSPTDSAANTEGELPRPSSTGQPSTNGQVDSATATAAESSLTAANLVYGRDQVMQLVKTLFPHRDMLNDTNDNSS